MWLQTLFNHFKPEFTNAIFMHHKLRIARDKDQLKWAKKIREIFFSTPFIYRKMQYVFRDNKLCLDASGWLKGLNSVNTVVGT